MGGPLRVWFEPWLMPACWSAHGILLRLGLLVLLLSWGVAVLAGSGTTAPSRNDAAVGGFVSTTSGFVGLPGSPF